MFLGPGRAKSVLDDFEGIAGTQGEYLASFTEVQPTKLINVTSPLITSGPMIASIC